MGSWPVEGKTALITGAARGIGAHTARELAARGARVALVGLEPEELRARAAEIGEERAIAITADVCDPAALDAAAAQTARHFGGIDIVVANAGIASFGSVSAVDPGAFAKTVDINLTGVYRTAAATIEHLRRSKGYFLAISSMTSFTPFGGSSAYVSSKAGVEAFCLSFGSEERGNGVRIGSAHPAWIETDLVHDLEAELEVFSKMRRWMPWPISSTLTPAECARQIADGIEGRKIRVYVPRSMALLFWLRPFMWSATNRWLSSRLTKRWMDELDADVRRLGRSASARTQALDMDDQGDPGAGDGDANSSQPRERSHVSQ